MTACSHVLVQTGGGLVLGSLSGREAVQLALSYAFFNVQNPAWYQVRLMTAHTCTHVCMCVCVSVCRTLLGTRCDRRLQIISYVYVGLARTVFIHCVFGEIPAKNTVYTPYIYGSGQPYIYVYI